MSNNGDDTKTEGDGISITKMCDALGKYYNSIGKGQEYVNADGVGLFAAWCEENGMDGEELQEDLGSGAKDSLLSEFPLALPPQKRNLTEEQKQAEVWRILVLCRDNPAYFESRSSGSMTLSQETLDTVNDADIETVKRIFKTYCPSIFNKGVGQDVGMLTMLALSHKHKIDCLSNLVDSYNRYRVLHDASISAGNWGKLDDNTHFTKKPLKNATVNVSGKRSAYQEIATASLASFNNRCCTNLMVKHNTKVIADSIEQFVKYLVGATDFVVGTLIKTNQQICPFQIDFCVAYENATTTMSKEDESGNEDDDDTDDDDGDDDGKQADEKPPDFIQDIPEKLKQNKLKHFKAFLAAGDTNAYRKFGEVFTSFLGENEIKAVGANGQHYLQHKQRQIKAAQVQHSEKMKALKALQDASESDTEHPIMATDSAHYLDTDSDDEELPTLNSAGLHVQMSQSSKLQAQHRTEALTPPPPLSAHALSLNENKAKQLHSPSMPSVNEQQGVQHVPHTNLNGKTSSSISRLKMSRANTLDISKLRIQHHAAALNQKHANEQATVSPAQHQYKHRKAPTVTFANGTDRKYRSKYSGHYKLSLASAAADYNAKSKPPKHRKGSKSRPTLLTANTGPMERRSKSNGNVTQNVSSNDNGNPFDAKGEKMKMYSMRKLQRSHSDELEVMNTSLVLMDRTGKTATALQFVGKSQNEKNKNKKKHRWKQSDNADPQKHHKSQRKKPKSKSLKYFDDSSDKNKSRRSKKEKKSKQKQEKKGIMEHIRSRSQTFASMRLDSSGFKIKPHLAKSKSVKKSKSRSQHEIIKFNCIAKQTKPNDADQRQNDDEKHQGLSPAKNIDNGIIGVHMTETFVFRAIAFWNENITLGFSDSQFREASTLFFSHLMVNISKYDSDTKILLNSTKNDGIIEAPLKYFDMIGFLLRLLVRSDVDAHSTLLAVGKLHLNAYNVSIESYLAMLNALHTTFCELFPRDYSLPLRYVFDTIFIHSVLIMNKHNKRLSEYMSFINQKLDTLSSLYFLQSLDMCLVDEIGSEYMYHFLNQSFCTEITKFLKLYNSFKHCNASSHRLKYNISLKIYSTCISDSSQYQINVPFGTYQQIKSDINQLKEQYVADVNALNVSNDIFDVAYEQIKRLIIQNHWCNFKHVLHAVHKDGQLVK